MRFATRVLSFAVLLAGFIVPGALAQSGGTLGDIQQKLRQMYTFAKTTDDQKDLAQAGTVLILRKDRFLMYPTAAVAPALNVYKDGALNYGKMREFQVFSHLQEVGLTPQTVRKFFLTGEKFFITAVDTDPDGVVLTLYSDPLNNVRYYGQLKIQFQKRVVPPTDDVIRQVQEVLTPDTSSGAAPAAATPPAHTPAASGGTDSDVKPLPLPPPPPAEPKTVSIGQTEDQVVAALGPPATIVDKKAAGKIFMYKDMKVIFKLGKVVDIQ
jgi:hypothetical protein